MDNPNLAPQVQNEPDDENKQDENLNEDIINQLIKFGFTKDEIMSAMQTVVDKNDINAVQECITQNQSSLELKHIKNKIDSKDMKNKIEPNEEKVSVSKNTHAFPVSVYVRMRPLVGDELKENHKMVEYSVKTMKKSKRHALTLKKVAGNNSKRDKKYSGFKHVISPGKNNQQTYSVCIAPSIDDIFAGVATCAFAYGHTGSGKTHTIFGYDAEPGMYRLFAQALCARVRALQNDTVIEIRFLELYQSVIRDLLSKQKTECFLREDDKGTVHLRGQTVKYDQPGKLGHFKVSVLPITSFMVTTAAEIDKYIMEGMASRNVGKSTLHDKSSRSHAFLEFEIVNKALVNARIELPDKEATLDAYKREYDIEKMNRSSRVPKMEKKIKKIKARIKALKKLIFGLENDADKAYIAGKYVFVDLAGNEYGRDVKTKDKQEEKERNEINKSLFALKECIRGLHDNKKRVPYRGSKLTMYLRRYLQGDGSKAIMITNIGPSKQYTKQTINTLQYCQLVAKA